jgi:vacuolar-type H+-ATPase subunit D/Vma8
VTSQRKLKKRAEAQGMTGPELQLVEMLQEILGEMRWMQILAYTNQYLLNQKLKVTQDERDQILEAATRAVDKDSKLHEWTNRLDRLKSEIVNIKRKVNRARKDIEQGAPAPVPPRLPFPEPPEVGLADAAES